MVAGLPGLWMLHRFAPWGVRDPNLDATDDGAATTVPRLPAGAVLKAQVGDEGVTLWSKTRHLPHAKPPTV